ncbi:MAG: hypothetical protein GY766_00035 [Herbaspirillum sp.]|uniref:hypothetical protein n=1 Tax=Herbaspirillum sp. TaxID=1890675 RepID=UPI0025877914|nr:hypothetical protein [Herbaspirillum sp.]MCP3653275.1 hypothetical protein [Herbaspirillum sp.]
MSIFSIIGNLLGIGKDALNNKAKLKRLKQEQDFAILEAQTKANVDRILSNTDSDNQIDLITAQQKDKTFKDEVVTYLFLIPVFIATVSPFIIAFKENNFTHLPQDIRVSYENLNQLPNWYKYVLGAIIIDVLGFRSFARKLVDKYLK